PRLGEAWLLQRGEQLLARRDKAAHIQPPGDGGKRQDEGYRGPAGAKMHISNTGGLRVAARPVRGKAESGYNGPQPARRPLGDPPRHLGAGYERRRPQSFRLARKFHFRAPAYVGAGSMPKKAGPLDAQLHHRYE